MLRIEDIRIEFSGKRIINSGSLIAQPGKLILLQGESGSGKSSLLKEIALVSKQMHCRYVYDNQEVNLLSVDEKENMQLYDIAYMPQNCSLINDFTVIDLLKWHVRVNQGDDKSVNDVIKKLELEKLQTKKIKYLSGGERQRVAFGCTYLKNAQIYLLDEPISMIDNHLKNIVVEMIEELVSNNKIVIVATHDLDYFNHYSLYTINQAELINHDFQIKEELHFDIVKHTSRKILMNSLSINYILNSPIIHCMTIIFTAVCVSLIIAMFAIGFINTKQQQDSFSDFYSCELFVVNDFSHSGTFLDSMIYQPISLDVVDKIIQLDGVKSAEPFLPMYVDFLYYDYHSDEMLPRTEQIMDIQVIDDGVISFEGNLKEFYTNIDQHYSTNESFGIYPIYSHQKYDERCEKVMDNNGVYISKQLADYLGIEDVHGQKIIINMAISVAESLALYSIEGQDEEIKTARMPFSILDTMELPVKGILKSNLYGNYGYLNYVDIFMPIDQILAYQKEIQQKYEHIINQKLTIPTTIKVPGHSYETTEITKPEWLPSAYVINVDSKEKIDVIKGQIERLSPDLIVSVSMLSSGKINKDATTAIKNIILLANLGITIVAGIGVSMIQYFQLNARKRDIQFLTSNGWSIDYIQKIFFKENIYKTMIGILVSCIMTYTFFSFINQRIPYTLSYSLGYIMLNAVMYTVFLMSTFVIGNSISIKRVNYHD